MPNIRGLLHSKPKTDEEELALAQSRAAERLTDLTAPRPTAAAEAPLATGDFLDMVEDLADGGGIRPAGSDVLVPDPAGPRPPIIVEGVEPAGVDSDNGQPKHVDVMARLREQMGYNNSQTQGLGVPASPSVEADVRVDTSSDSVKDGAESRPPVVPEGDSDMVAVGWETSLAQHVDAMARTPEDVGDATLQMPADGPLPATSRRAQPRVRSHRGPSQNGSGSLSATSSPGTGSRMQTVAAPQSTASCPYCALVLEPAPTSSQRCSRCRQRIIVKRIEGRAVFLTEAAVPVFVAEGRRIAASGRLTRERDRWLRHAASAGAPAKSQARLATARLTVDVVVAARALYLTTADRAFRLAKREHDWEMASRLRREKATVLYRVAGSPLPPPAEFVDMYREGVAAELRGLAEISRDAELVSASCCDVCRADDRLISRISQELRVPRLPHDGCPKGLCRCHWDLAERKRTTMRRYLRRRPRTESGPPPSQGGPST
jgi:hypothetical protein